MGLLRTISLLAVSTALVGASSCPFSDLNGFAITSYTAKGAHRLICPTAAIDVIEGMDIRSFDSVVCVGGEWYALSCDGTAAFIGAAVTVSCDPNPEVVACEFNGVNQGFPPTVGIVNGAQVRTCGAGGPMSVEGLDSDLGLTIATCMPGGKWMAFSCGGEAEIVQGALAAHCANAPPPPTTTTSTTTTTLPPTTTFNLGELKQYDDNWPLCRSGSCPFRLYSTEEGRFVKNCIVDGPNNSTLYAMCTNSKRARIDGVVVPGFHFYFVCVKTGPGVFHWESRGTQDRAETVEVPENPIVRCDGH